MIAGMLFFILGAIFGGSAFAVMYRMFTAQIERLRKRNDKLVDQANAEHVELERSRAYRKGFYEGSKAKETENRGE